MLQSSLFEPIQIGRFHAKNHFVRAATKEELCDREGHLPAELMEIYRRFVAGGVGTIIVSSARVRLFDGTPHGGLLRLDRPELLEEYSALAALGKKNNTTMLIQATYTHRDIDALTHADMDAIVAEHIKAARFAEAAGFDGIQLHEAHGMFLNQILSPKYNHRTDEYGVNKNLLAERILTAIRENTGKDFIIINKVNCQDFEEGGQTEEDSLRYCKRMAALGIDAIEVSGGNAIRPVHGHEDESYFHSFAARLRREINIPVILVGGNRSLPVLERLHQEEGIDMFSMSRALTCEPDLIHRWEQGDVADGKCRYCGACWQTHAHQCIYTNKK